jgi:hypothetical protein
VSPRVAGEDPGADLEIDAGVGERRFVDAVRRQRRQPGGVDLHETDIARAVPVAVQGLGVESALRPGHRLQYFDGNAMDPAGIFPAGRENRSGEKSRQQREHENRFGHGDRIYPPVECRGNEKMPSQTGGVASEMASDQVKGGMFE